MLALFTITLFVSATLLFWIQPMFTKMVLPLLGGSPAVWNTAMMFFQAALLAGYAYAHVTTRLIGPRRQAVLHLCLLLVALITLPVTVGEGWQPPAESNPVLWLVMLLAVSLGLPFFVIAANAPMLQMWFAHTRHPAAANPYFLYAASNLGSMMALLGYPIVIEPLLRLGQQSWAWSGGYGLLGLLTLGCAGLMWRRFAPAGVETIAESAGGARPQATLSREVTLEQRLRWVVLAFAPSSMLLGVTTYLTTDIAAVPLFWVVPLSLYLLTFVIVFSRKPVIAHAHAVRAQPFFLLVLVILLFWGLADPVAVLYPMHLVVFFLAALVCHGELASRRPSVDHLTEFYLWMSVGGLLGGVFNALVAPVIFDSILEYPLAIALTAALRPYLVRGKAPRLDWRDLLLPVLLGLILVATMWATGEKPSRLGLWGLIALSCAVGMVLYSFRLRPLRFGLGIGAVLLAAMSWGQDQDVTLMRERNFFGVVEVARLTDKGFHLLYHGTTIHGAQSLDPARRLEPISYYGRSGPIGQAIAALDAGLDGARVAAVGLGAGNVACYARPGQQWTFYEIDPAIERVARDGRYFTYLRDCAPEAEVVLGDARLRLSEAPDNHYRLMILDAFSSAAIPIHLLTREALELYMAKLEEGGVLAFHISNKHLDLAPVLGNLARSLGLVGLIQSDSELSEEEKERLEYISIWVLLARRADDLRRLDQDERWQPLPEAPGLGVWSDDFSNLLGAFKFKH